MVSGQTGEEDYRVCGMDRLEDVASSLAAARFTIVQARRLPKVVDTGGFMMAINPGSAVKVEKN